MKKNRNSWIFLIASILLLSLFGLLFFDFHHKLVLQENFEVEKYMGEWYSVYEFPAWFQQGCENTKAVYSLNDDGTVNILNSCERYGRVDRTEGIAYPLYNIEGRFKISFNNFPFSMGDYNVIATDYDTALVGTNNRRYLWILSREPIISDEKLSEYKTLAEELGFRTSKLKKVIHND
jgi:apolipoprotein D and lipocalin family protein